MKVRVGINGFGRIGRLVFRSGWDDPGLEFVAVNDITDAKTLAHLLKYDSVHGVWDKKVSAGSDSMTIDGKTVEVFSETSPDKLPWNERKVTVVIESTGRFANRAGAQMHLDAGAKKVIISAPAKDADVTIVPGVNHTAYDRDRHQVISMASCTTNCLAPVAMLINDNFGIKKGFMTTIHAYTNDQRILDQPHKDLRRARAAGLSMIPTTTGAARAIGLVIPELEGKLDGVAVRVPVRDGSLVDLVVELEKSATVEAVNEVLKSAASGEIKRFLEFCEDPIVSSDVVGNSHSSIVDGLSTAVLGSGLLKVLSWYDNEWGYACRVVDTIKIVMGEKVDARREVGASA